MIRKIIQHDLVTTFRQLKGNPKWSIYTEPLWFIPYTLFLPLHSIYMRYLGLSSLEIGFTISASYFIQIIFAIIGGIVTDKMGRRMATVIFDTLSWTIPCLIWAFSQNFWWFMAASIINASYQITNTSWNCLFIEDCPPRLVTNAFTLIQLCGMLSVFVSPLTLFLVSKYSVVPVVRWIYFISAFSMLLKFILLYHFGSETVVGRQRRKDTQDLSFFTMLFGYKDVFLKILKSKQMILVVLFMALSNISLIATGSFFSLYITEHVLLPTALVAVFPMIRTSVMLLFVIVLQNFINRMQMKISIIIGFAIYISSHLCLIFTPEKSLFFIMLYTVLEASAYAIVIPRRETLMALYVDPKERSRIYALYNSIMIAITTPFGSIVGGLYDINPAYPFIFNIIIFTLGILLVLLSKDLSHIEKMLEKTATAV